ncbi:MAG TPA: TIM barrel protein [Terriglobia bacterium]|nr:TIM barrel protein [Terriglobia bacterium]
MKIGLCLEMALLQLPFEARVRKAAELGFERVEIWWVDSSFKGTPEQLARLAEEAGVKFTDTVINAPDGSMGGNLTDPRQNMDVFMARAQKTLDYTREAQIPATIVLTGNRVAGLDEKTQEESVVERLKSVVDMAEKAGVTVLLEPLNDLYDHPDHWLTSSDKGAAICRRIGSPRLRLLFDTYHMRVMEGDLVKHIERNIDVIGHFHAAGVPGRHEVFAGETNYPFVLKKIEEMGYKGAFGLEYSPSTDDEASLKQSLAYLKG